MSTTPTGESALCTRSGCGHAQTDHQFGSLKCSWQQVTFNPATGDTVTYCGAACKAYIPTGSGSGSSPFSTGLTASLAQYVALTSGMTARQMTQAIQDALDAVDLAGGGEVAVLPAFGVTITLDDMLSAGDHTTLRFWDQQPITRVAHTKAAPVLAATISSGGVNGSITALAVSSQPGGYVHAPRVVITGSQMESAVCYAFVDGAVGNGSVTSVYIQNGGWGYASSPTFVGFESTFRPDYVLGSRVGHLPTITLQVSGGHVTGFTIVDAGEGLNYSGWVPLRVRGGRHMRATATIDGSGNLASITVNQGGANYYAVRPYQTSGTGASAYAIGGCPGVVAPMVTNKDWFNGNAYINVIGGIWDGNITTLDPTKVVNDFAQDCFKFVGVDHVTVRPTGFRNFGFYTAHFQNCWDVKIGKHWTYSCRDDMHLTGHNRYVTHEGVEGSTSDDIFTCTATGYVDELEAGDIEHVYVRDVVMHGSSFALAVWGGLRPDGTSYRINNITYDGVRGSSLAQLMRISAVEAIAAGGIGRITFKNVEIDGQSTFTDVNSVVRTAPIRSLINVDWMTVDQLDIQLKHRIYESGNTVTPTLLEVNHSAAIRELNADLDVQWACAASASLLYFTSGTLTAPQRVRVKGRVECGAGSSSVYVLAFASGSKAPTKETDLSDLVVKNMNVCIGLYAATNYLRVHGSRFENAIGEADIAYDGILHASMVGNIFDGAHDVFVPISAGTLHWHGSGNQLINGATVAHTTSHVFYPRDFSLAISLTHTANVERLAKLAGVHFITGTGGDGASYGIPNAAMMVVDRDFDGTLWYQALGTSERAMVASFVAPGTGYAANDLLTIAAGTWVNPPIIKVLTVNGSGVILTVSVAYSGRWEKARSGGTLAVTGGAGSGATFQLNPL